MNVPTPYGPPMLDNLPFLHQGKTRDTFRAQWFDPSIKLRSPRLIVATDRLSTHNVVHLSLIPKKGEVLTALTIFWLADVFRSTEIKHHLVAYGKRGYDYLPGQREDYRPDLHHRAIVVRELKMDKVEFILRAYLAGSLAAEYHKKRRPRQPNNPYGLKLPKGLPLMHKFEELIFTPTEKSRTDDPLWSSEVERNYREEVSVCRRAFALGRLALNRVGIEAIDTKFEVGRDEEGNLRIADEVLTPDSSRFTRLVDIKEEENPPWLDKQLARDEAERIWGKGTKTPLEFPPEVIAKLTRTYLELFERITGKSLDRFQKERLD